MTWAVEVVGVQSCATDAKSDRFIELWLVNPDCSRREFLLRLENARAIEMAATVAFLADGNVSPEPGPDRKQLLVNAYSPFMLAYLRRMGKP